ncbi:hypothetical protein GCM10010195_24380 [Kitasatospora griseola]|nr:hypothetical protein GCM10010195_24380 [Kitasatospora griseola]
MPTGSSPKRERQYEHEARRRDVEGRSKMNKHQLENTLGR